jgi:hypothetical protein
MHGVTPGTGVVWLSPGVARSVEPKVMPEPTTPELVLGVVDPEPALPAPDICAAAEPALPEEAELQLLDRFDPPPSKAAFELVFGHGIASGLTPGVLISVAPSGIPPSPDAFAPSEELSEDGVPSGEVGPMPGVAVVWASAATIPQQATTTSSQNGYRIERPSVAADVSRGRPWRRHKASTSAEIGRRRPVSQTQ